MLWSPLSELFGLEDGPGNSDFSNMEEEEVRGLVYHRPGNSGKRQIKKKISRLCQTSSPEFLICLNAFTKYVWFIVLVESAQNKVTVLHTPHKYLCLYLLE